MAKEKEQQEAQAPPPKAGKKKTLFIAIAAVVAVVVAGGGFFAYKSMSGSSASASDHGGGHGAEESSHGGGGGGGHGGESSASTLHTLDPFIVNLRDNSGTRYLKLTVNLELSSTGAVDELKANTAKVRDSLIILLSSKSYADIGTAEGKYQLRDEVVARANQYLSDGSVKTAYFTEFVIQ